MEPRAPVSAETVAKVTLSLRCRSLGTDSWSVRLLPRVTLGLAFFRARLDLRLLALLDVLRKLLVRLSPVLRSRSPRTSGIYNQAFAQPRFAI